VFEGDHLEDRVELFVVLVRLLPSQLSYDSPNLTFDEAATRDEEGLIDKW
jgi:hypothetical protein